MERNVTDAGGGRDSLHTAISETAYSRLAYGFSYWE
jgi:hypothetical protein